MFNTEKDRNSHMFFNNIFTLLLLAPRLCKALTCLIAFKVLHNKTLKKKTGLREVPGALCTRREYHMEATGLLLSECFPSNPLTCRPTLGKQRHHFIDEHRRCSRQDKKPKSPQWPSRTSLRQSSMALKTLQGLTVYSGGQKTEAGRSNALRLGIEKKLSSIEHFLLF